MTPPKFFLRSLRGAFAMLALVIAAWSCGFGWFVHSALQPPPPARHADGIVALTGGAERVATALHLLSDGYGSRLLVSGVNPVAEFADLAHRAGVTTALADRVTLGKAASDTYGNAVETAEWARRHDIGSLIVVTAGYHMPRALAELARTMPDVKFYPYPVLSPALRGPTGSATLKLLAGEYTKWLAAEAGLSSLAASAPVTREHVDPAEPSGEARAPG